MLFLSPSTPWSVDANHFLFPPHSVYILFVEVCDSVISNCFISPFTIHSCTAFDCENKSLCFLLLIQSLSVNTSLLVSSSTFLVNPLSVNTSLLVSSSTFLVNPLSVNTSLLVSSSTFLVNPLSVNTSLLVSSSTFLVNPLSVNTNILVSFSTPLIHPLVEV